jgi:phage-related minor tail protein
LPSGDLPADTQLRFLTAKVKMLSKQVDDTNEIRRELGEQCADLQRQLKTEREENKNLKKRYCAFGVA